MEVQSLKNHFISFDKNKCKKGKGKNIYSSQNVNSYSSRLGIKSYKTKQKKCDEILLKNNIFHFLPQQNNNVSLFDRFINLLVIDGRFEYIVSLFKNLIKYQNIVTNTYGNNIPGPREVVQLIRSKIGVCHLINSGFKGLITHEQKKLKMKVYLVELVSMVETALAIFFENVSKFNTENKQNDYIQKVIDKYFLNLGGRPCLDNAIDELLNSIMTPAFNWKGKSRPINFWNQSHVQYYKNQVIAPAMMSYLQSLDEMNQNSFKQKSSNNKINQMWNVFSKHQVWTRRNQSKLPDFWYLKNINRLSNYNIKKITTDTMQNYVNYME